ncbi:MAG: serine/threonine protein kinase [Deltaproteobacteria bacterium]|nr:serine/threonine protein kinase [Deltaproteobacteria bacterium]
MRCLICQAEIEDASKTCPVCGSVQSKFAAPEDGNDPLIGKKIGKRFLAKELLGVGGMGKVFLVLDEAMGKDAVVKVLHDYLASEKKLVLRFGREWRALRRINHPNIVKVLDFSLEEGGLCYMAMEYIDGVDLTALFNTNAEVSEKRIIRIGIQVCRALAAAHGSKVIHRDLKPENIMLTRAFGMDDFVKVLDFGIAKIQDPDDATGVTLTMAGEAFGTFEYMSPEQAQGVKGRDLDGRSDLYQLGVMLYELITKQLPFTSENPLEILNMIQDEQVVPPSVKVPGLQISKDFENIILKVLEKKRENRFESAVHMEKALSRLLAPADLPRVVERHEEPRSMAKGRGMHFDAGKAAYFSGSRGRQWNRAASIARFLFSCITGSKFRIALASIVVALLLGITLVLAALTRGEYHEVREAIDDGHPVIALKLLSAKRDEKGKPMWFVMKARAYLAFRRPRYAKAAYFLQRAIKLSRERVLADDDGIGKDLVFVLNRPGGRSYMKFLSSIKHKESLIEPLLRGMKSRRYWLRWNSIAVLRRMGLGDKVDLTLAYIEDLKGRASCAVKKRALGKLVAMHDRRALETIRKLAARGGGKTKCFSVEELKRASGMIGDQGL